MLAASVTAFGDARPFGGLRAAAVDFHDLWALRGVDLSAPQFPSILGCDVYGVDAVAKLTELTLEEAARLLTTWLTADRMFFTKVRAEPGSTKVLPDSLPSPFEQVTQPAFGLIVDAIPETVRF